MKSLEEYKNFAEECLQSIAAAISKRDFDSFSKHFDPELDDDFSKSDFEEAIIDEQEGLGLLMSHKFFGHVKGNQNDFPGSIRFVYGGKFTQGEGLIILCVHERDGELYLNEHIYYWD